MSLLTVDEARALINTALNEAQLQMVINREEAEIVKRLGAVYDGTTAIVETVSGLTRNVYLRRGIGSVSAVTERLTIDDSPVTLEADDYFVWSEEGRLERKPRGQSWGAVVTVTYISTDDRQIWKQILTELVRIALERTAMKSESVAGEYSYSAPEWDEARAKLIREISFWNV